MKFPITRETLQSYDYEKVQEVIRDEEMQKKIDEYLDVICIEFKRMLLHSVREKRFVWGQGQHRGELQQLKRFSKVGSNDYYPQFIPQLIDKLKKLFIGCDIIIDPLQTYLIIDWS